MADLTTTYLGLKLENPLIVASSGLTSTLDGVKECADAGAGAVVLKSLFEEQVRVDMKDQADGILDSVHPEAVRYLEADVTGRFGSRDYLRLIEKSKEAVPIPVIASLNATAPGTWTTFASQIQASGADALELNIYVLPIDPERDARDIEQTYFDVLTSVLEKVTIPVAVKIAPFFTNVSHMVLELERRGARGIVMFNRFLQPDFDLSRLSNRTTVTFSEPHEMRLPLRWIALLSDDVKCDLCASTGVHDHRGALKQILAGAAAVQLCSTLYRNRLGHLGVVARAMDEWLDDNGHASVTSIRGRLNQAGNPQPEAFERSQYIKALTGVE
jgi:dihydroorotate dehydrogenase (fumarate)